jgi:ribosomal protein S18 acetylase RimI-like enzyme
MVDLNKMTEEDYLRWRENAVRDYAEEHITGGRWTRDNALQESEKEFDQLLPDGLATQDNYLFSIISEQGEKVGCLWYAVRGSQNNRYAFVFDFVIFEPYRRHGYGSQAFLALESEVKSRGLNSIRLHVFGHNKPARELYKTLGYIETNVNMRKDLGSDPIA